MENTQVEKIIKKHSLKNWATILGWQGGTIHQVIDDLTKLSYKNIDITMEYLSDAYSFDMFVLLCGNRVKDIIPDNIKKYERNWSKKYGECHETEIEMHWAQLNEFLRMNALLELETKLESLNIEISDDIYNRLVQ